MLEYKEVSPLPEICRDCQEEECYNCDYLLERWQLSAKDKEWLKNRLRQQAIDRLMKQE